MVNLNLKDVISSFGQEGCFGQRHLWNHERRGLCLCGRRGGGEMPEEEDEAHASLGRGKTTEEETKKQNGSPIRS